MSTHTPARLLETAVEAAREGALAALSESKKEVVVVDKSHDEALNPVTAADLASDDVIRRTILGAYPNDSIICEESKRVIGQTDVRWIVDSIDGTFNFMGLSPITQ